MFKFHVPQFLINKSVQMTLKQAFRFVPDHPVAFGLLPKAVALTEPVSGMFYRIHIEKVDLENGVKGEWVGRRGTELKDDKVIFYIHGGGFISASPATHRIITSCLSKYTGRRVFAVDYTKAPMQKFPYQINECVKAYKYLIAMGYRGEDIAIMGDSAGGNLSLTTTIKIMQEMPEHKPACVVPISPWTDLTNNGPSLVYNESNDVMIPVKKMLVARNNYVPDTSDELLRNPLVSPAFADFTNFPPMQIHVGDKEVLLSDAKFLNKNAKAQGANSTLKIWPGCGHVFQMWAALRKDSRNSLKDIANFAKTHWGV